MGFNRPTEEQVRQIFTQFDEIKFLKAGGFKAVYKVSTKGNIEAFKIVFIPVYGQAEISSEVRKESFARVKREIIILNNLSITNSPITNYYFIIILLNSLA